jgi:hypothetical protein
MKNECQKDGVPRDPLIFAAPTLNLVTILSVGWLDNIGRTAVSAKTGALQGALTPEDGSTAASVDPAHPSWEQYCNK